MTQAFASGTGFTHVVISIGGNDFLDTGGCMMGELLSRHRSRWW